MNVLNTFPDFLSRTRISIEYKDFDFLPLLYSITIVSLAGALKLYFAREFLGIEVPFAYLVAAGLIAFSAYAFDRGVDCKEDEERGELFKKTLLSAAIVAVIASFILFPNPLMVIPYAIAYLYAKGIRGHRLKGGCGVKNTVVAFSWSLGIVIFLGVGSVSALLVYIFFFVKSFVNTVIYDVRDIERDTMAGIATLPSMLGFTHLKLFLGALSVGIHGLVLCAYYAGLIAGGDVILLSLLHSSTYICLYCSRRDKFRNTLVDGEWVLYGGYVILRDFLL